MSLQVDLLTNAFPGKSSAGALGLSSCALIRTNGKIILFDTGAHGIIKVLEKSLEKYGIDPLKVDAIFLSHLHYDHLNNIAIYPNAELIIGRREWEYANTTKDEWTPLESIEYIKNRRNIRLVDDNEEIMPGLTALWTPGHTPGQMSLAVDTPEGLLIMAGDAVKNRSELEQEFSDMSLNEADSIASIRRIKQMAYKVLPGHDSYLLIKDGKVIPESTVTLDISLPKGCEGGDNGVYHLKL